MSTICVETLHLGKGLYSFQLELSKLRLGNNVNNASGLYVQFLCSS